MSNTDTKPLDPTSKQQAKMFSEIIPAAEILKSHGVKFEGNGFQDSVHHSVMKEVNKSTMSDGEVAGPSKDKTTIEEMQREKLYSVAKNLSNVGDIASLTKDQDMQKFGDSLKNVALKVEESAQELAPDVLKRASDNKAQLDASQKLSEEHLDMQLREERKKREENIREGFDMTGTKKEVGKAFDDIARVLMGDVGDALKKAGVVKSESNVDAHATPAEARPQQQGMTVGH